MNQDLISIIVPVYNIEKYIVECIESIRNQSYRKLEIILIDDGSTDDSGKICDEYLQKDDRIKVVHQENQGVSVARNQGIAMCNGTYVFFIDGDDYVGKDYIKILYEKIMSQKYDVAISNAIIVQNNEEKQFNDLKQEIELTNQEVIKKLLSGRDFQTVCWGKMYKTEIVKKIKFNTKMKIAEDLDFLLKVFENCDKIILIPNYSYYYRIRNNSAVRTMSTKTFEEFKYCEGLIEQYKNTELEKYAIKHYVNVNMSYAFHYDLTDEEIARIKCNISKYKAFYSLFSDASRNEKIKYKLLRHCYKLAKKVL